MSAKPKQCPRCGIRSRRINCCGIILGVRRRWRMTPALVRQVHVIAHVRKGLDKETYQLHLTAVGVETSKRLTRDQHHALLQRFSALPDAPRWKPRQSKTVHKMAGMDAFQVSAISRHHCQAGVVKVQGAADAC